MATPRSGTAVSARALEALRLVRDLAVAGNQATSASEVLQLAVDRVCALVKCTDGHAYDRHRLEESGGYLGTGLAEKVLRSGKPEWVADTGFAFPVVVGSEVVAVLEFSAPASPPDEVLLDVIGQVGAILGGVVERERTLAALRELSLSDELTGIYNRRGFLTLAAQMLRVAARQRTPATIFFADLDGLKSINDQHGHATGDRAIQEAATILRASFRTSDVVGRLGGDELAVFALNAAPQHADLCIARVLGRLSERNADSSVRYRLSLSFGCAFFDATQPRDLDVLLAEADAKMYAAKKSRRN